MDFTLRKYADLCAALVAEGYISMGMGDYLEDSIDLTPTPLQVERGLGGEVNPTDQPRVVLLRHDVDSRPAHALKMAEIERRYGLTATYFFRTVPAVFDPQTIRQIHALGHEIGYHYETLSQTHGDIERAIVLFGGELEKLRRLAPVKIASMHGSPLSPWDNRAIWEQVQPSDFGLVGEVYRDVDYTRVIYLSDTGRSWNPTRYNVRDRTGVEHPFRAESTDEVIALLSDPRLRHLCLLTHPERWQDNRLAWGLQAARDVMSNIAKVILKRIFNQ
jgi:hypothetical protein